MRVRDHGQLLTSLSTIGRMTLAMSRATDVEALEREALAAIHAVAGTSAAAVLLFDRAGVMRFVASSDLSERYRTAVEGHTPWRPGQRDAVPLLIAEPAADPGLAPYAEIIRAEGIRAMAMFPLVTGGGVIGKFMVYHREPHAFDAEEVQLLDNIAAHTAFAIDRQRATDALRQSEERYRSLVDHLREVVFETDAEGRWTFLNSSWEALTGFTIAESLGRRFLDFVHPDDHTQTMSALAAIVSGAVRQHTEELRYVAKGGGHRWVECLAQVVRAADGAVLAIRGTLSDITERRAAADGRREAELRLHESQRLEGLGVLAGGIAHDFNNLLMGVLGNAGIALSELPPASPAEGPIQDIVIAARRAADLTRQLLAYGGRGRFNVGPLDLVALVKESAHLLQTAISKKAALRYAFAASVPPIEADATQLRQVVMNLLVNASEALQDEPGNIDVTIEALDADRALLDRGVQGARLAPGRYVALEVRDNGSGMNEDTARRMFDPFFSTRAHGRGLGLAAVLGIVRGHEGTVVVDTTPGRGTSVRVLLPARHAALVGPTTREEPRPARATVLLVDDEELVRRAAQRMLAKAGCRSEQAENGRRALELLEALGGAVDLVLLDMTMPELSGEQTFDLIRARWPDLPVVLTSGYTNDAGRPYWEGPTAFLQKPYDPRALEALVDRMLALRSR